MTARRGSIEQRLPLLATLLLAVAIFAMSIAAYFEMRAFAIEETQSRLRQQASDFLALSGNSGAAVRVAQLDTAAAHPAMLDLVRSRGSRGRDAALAALQRLAPSSQMIGFQVLDSAGRALWATADSLPDGALEPVGWGALRTAGGTQVVYAIAQPISDGAREVGQLVERRRVVANPASRRAISTLMGGAVQMIYGNVRSDVWTDIDSLIPPPTPGSVRPGEQARYIRDGAMRVAAAAAVPGTPWMLVLEVPEASVLGSARRYLARIAVIAGLVVLIVAAAAWVLSRSLTTPLKSLTRAAEAIAAGDDGPRAPIDRDDELGRLSEAFNVMAVRVGEARRTLEQQVAERTQGIRQALEQLQAANDALKREGAERERADGEVRSLNATLQRQIGELEAVNHELETFSYSVSHDLRAPLRAIDGFSRIVTEQYAPALDDEGKRLLSVVRDNTVRMGRLIDDLLEFSRLGRKALRVERVNMSDLVRGLVDDARRSAPRAEVIIGELPAARGDAGLLRQVWANLIDNALKYSRTQPHPRVEIGMQADGNGEVGYAVRDNGVGFDMAYVHQLFGVFHRLHAADAFEGTGVGLAIVQRIVHRHGGRVWASGAPGNGATFSFTLPGGTGDHAA